MAAVLMRWKDTPARITSAAQALDWARQVREMEWVD